MLVQKAGEAVARDVSIANGTEAYGFTPDGRALVLLESPVMDGGTAQDTTYLWTPEGGPATKVGKGNPWSLSADGRWVSVGYAGFEPKDLDSSVLASLQDAGLDPKAVLDPVTPAPSLTFSPTGAGLPFAVALPRTFENAGYAFLTRDDQSAIFQAQDHGTPRWYLVDRKGGAPRRLTADGYGVAFSGLSALSPDGTRLIVGGDGTFAIQALAGGDPQPVKGLVGSERPIGWCQDQTAVFTRTMTLPIVVNRLDLATGTRRPVFTYNPGDASGLLRIRNVETTPSGSVFALSYVRQMSNLFLVDGIN